MPKYIEKTIEHNTNLKKKIQVNNKDKDIKPYNIKNMKKDFREMAKKYKLNDKDKFIYKKYIKEKDYNGLLKEKLIELRLPTVKELNLKLYEYNCKNFHCNYIDVQDKFFGNNIGFYGLNSVIEEYANNCPACVQNSKTFHRMEPVKAINVDGPNQKYEFDLTHLNKDLAYDYGVKMLLSIIDAFSRKDMIYKANDKKADNLIKDILEFCVNNSFPKEFCSDNGPNFKIQN